MTPEKPKYAVIGAGCGGQAIAGALAQSGYDVTTPEGKLRIIQADYLCDNEEQSSLEYAIRVGRALFNVFFGGDWDPEFKFIYPTNLPVFTKQVLEETRKIPKGTVTTYGEIAERIGSPGGARAVGNALGNNPLPLIIPCHRVVRGDGSLSGYGGGLWRKQSLLDHERRHC